jgi:hypothetical protein
MAAVAMTAMTAMTSVIAMISLRFMGFGGAPFAVGLMGPVAVVGIVVAMVHAVFHGRPMPLAADVPAMIAVGVRACGDGHSAEGHGGGTCRAGLPRGAVHHDAALVEGGAYVGFVHGAHEPIPGLDAGHGHHHPAVPVMGLGIVTVQVGPGTARDAGAHVVSGMGVVSGVALMAAVATVIHLRRRLLPAVVAVAVVIMSRLLGGEAERQGEQAAEQQGVSESKRIHQ